MDDYILKIDNLCARNNNGDQEVGNASLELKKGVIHALVGESGSGKTTFYNALSGKIQEVSGTIIYDGNVTKLDAGFRGIKDISYIQRNPDLIRSLSIAENLALFNHKRRRYLSLINNKDVSDRARHIFHRFGLNIDPGKLAYNLSMEERKAAELAKSFFQNRQVSIFHEPSDGISVEMAAAFYSMLYELTKTGKSFLIITKEWEEALKYADYISVIVKGRVVQTLTASSAREHPYEFLVLMQGAEKNGAESAKFMDAVFKAAEYLTSEYQLNDLLSYISEQVSQLMNADMCVLDLIDSQTGASINQVTYTKHLAPIHAKVQMDKVIELFKKGSSGSVCLTSDDPRFTRYLAESSNLNTFILVPINLRDNLAGVLQLYFAGRYDYQERELFYLETMARQAAVAIDNTRLMVNSTLLMESHHRIKNNLQIIVSLIDLQRESIKNGDTRSVEDILQDVMSRVSSIASVHELLSTDGAGRSILNVRKLFGIIADLYHFSNVELASTVDDVFMSYSRATSLALLYNELLNNCIKHAFPGNRTGKIQVMFSKNDDDIILEVNDNGVGLPADFDLNTIDSLGLFIVKGIVNNEFNGRLCIERNPSSSGTRVRVTFSSEYCL